MSEDYTLKYTNGYANYGNIDESELVVNGDCKITNYDPRENNGNDAVKKGSITINFSEEEQSVKKGNGKELVASEKANFSKKKYSIFKEIAALDGNKEELSVEDIKKMDKSLIEKWRLKDLRYDYNNGVATLVWGKNDILRIDFKTWQEKLFGESKASKVKPEIEEIAEQDVAKEVDDKKESFFDKIKKIFVKESESDKLEFKGEIQESFEYTIKKDDKIITIANELGIPLSCIKAANPDANLDLISIGQKVVIPERKCVENCDIKNADDIVSYTGYSKQFIEELMAIEKFESEPYWDKKRYSVGYGHSGRILGKYINDENIPDDKRIEMNSKNKKLIKLSKEDACNILAQDILDRTAEAEAYFGSDFSRAPKSLQVGIVDIIFNAGIENSFNDDNTKKIKENLENNDYVSAVKNLILYPNNSELHKRNAYRVLMAL